MSQKKDSFFLAQKSSKPTLKSFKKVERHDKVSSTNKEMVEAKEKKPFDKKAYRLKKYSNKYKLEKWEDQRKKKLLRNYYKEVKNEAPMGSYKPIKFEEDSNQNKAIVSNPGQFVRHPDLIGKDENDGNEGQNKHLNSKAVKRDAFWRAKEEFGRLKQTKEDKKKEMESNKREREEKLLEYQRKKAEKFKKLSRKTRKGQPVMTGRLELLLEKIEQSK